MQTTMRAHWAKARNALELGRAITWDGCHKIYIAMDEAQVRLFQTYGYDPIIRITDPDEALTILQQWWDESCALRFISAVHTATIANDGFRDIIPQFADEDEED